MFHAEYAEIAPENTSIAFSFFLMSYWHRTDLAGKVFMQWFHAIRNIKDLKV